MRHNDVVDLELHKQQQQQQHRCLLTKNTTGEEQKRGINLVPALRAWLFAGEQLLREAPQQTPLVLTVHYNSHYTAVYHNTAVPPAGQRPQTSSTNKRPPQPPL